MGSSNEALRWAEWAVEERWPNETKNEVAKIQIRAWQLALNASKQDLEK